MYHFSPFIQWTEQPDQISWAGRAIDGNFRLSRRRFLAVVAIIYVVSIQKRPFSVPLCERDAAYYSYGSA
jgi:hypothetical protein